jgi:hypothetical protein
VVPGTGAIVGSPLPPVPPSRFMALISELLPAGEAPAKAAAGKQGNKGSQDDVQLHVLGKMGQENSRHAWAQGGACSGAIVGSALPPVPASRFIALISELLPAEQRSRGSR